MFGKKEPAEITSLIAQGTRIQGDMQFEEGLRIDGEVYGAIRSSREDGSLLVISEGALVEGGLQADHVIINGTVKGPVEARKRLELHPRARIEGEVQYAVLEMQHGATILGQLRPMTGTMAQEAAPVTRLHA